MPQVILLAIVSVQVLLVIAVSYFENRALLHQATNAFKPYVLPHLSERRLHSLLSGVGSVNSRPSLIEGLSLDEEALFRNWRSGEKARLSNSRMSRSQVRVQLYLHTESLQTEIDSVWAAAHFVSRLAEEHNDENLAITASELLSLHGRLSDQFSGLVTALREATASDA